MKTTTEKDYIDRITATGVQLDDATVLVNDFLRELDWDGLSDYCAELERLHKLAETENVETLSK